ncbi:hypothetical protein [Salinibacter altiplanensis]|uniref:hypothetical protein n=1 Tax=Salinibacter altiplanensis TaxID=1803181 RepID=UPI000C9FAB00|nr:hypothetical protein [Salinibacter altiplanensis]
MEQQSQSGYMPDVTLLGPEGEPIGAVEVLVTHEVGEAKSEELRLPWVEVEAEGVMTGHPIPVRNASFENPICNDCPARAMRIGRKIARFLKPLGLGLPPGYTLSFERCWHCDQPTPIYQWATESWTQESPPPPRPRTVQKRSTAPVGEDWYWANCCAYCNWVQGDFHQSTHEAQVYSPEEPSADRHPDVGPSFIQRLQIEGLFREVLPDEVLVETAKKPSENGV